jgi:hypothetical protein
MGIVVTPIGNIIVTNYLTEELHVLNSKGELIGLQADNNSHRYKIVRTSTITESYMASSIYCQNSPTFVFVFPVDGVNNIIGVCTDAKDIVEQFLSCICNLWTRDGLTLH